MPCADDAVLRVDPNTPLSYVVGGGFTDSLSPHYYLKKGSLPPAWGEEQENVRFVLVKNEASLPNNGPRSAEARVVLSKESPCAYKGTARATLAFSQEKQRRIVRKAFRKLDKINKKREEALSKDTSSVEKMETLVHLVISQDHTIRQQIQRIKELDREIDRYEAKVHFDRMKRHGINYVQDTYLVDTNPEAEPSGDNDKPCSAETFAQFEEYVRRCDEVIRLQEELAEHQALMDSITVEIQEELNQRWMKRRQEELSNKDTESITDEVAVRVRAATPTTETDTAQPADDISSENELLLEEERIKTQGMKAAAASLRLKRRCLHNKIICASLTCPLCEGMRGVGVIGTNK
ncbi:hypothetical protein JZ751_020781 [Albula glossodonta]|uniref:Uncharacterized protein n=1 Tax=Albula glossodonta TaxID=121402 RepID=A0A8T2PNG5_9TELE|nr:hypothetical protein JZ751_020781 [Albula glossodonta]